MKFLKGISLFFFYPLLFLGIGFYAGIEMSQYFYPGEQEPGEEQPAEISLASEEGEEDLSEAPEQEWEAYTEETLPEEDSAQESEEVMNSSETLCVDTDYVLQETDVLNHMVVETVWRLPEKYVGMNREQFLQAMEVYEAFPPLSEMERGFVGLDVLSFSRERVVVQMNYKFVQPSSSFYLAVYDNRVVVYLEDMETVYIETDIRLDSLPEQLQRNIIEMLWIENEEKLYDFLENYSS